MPNDQELLAAPPSGGSASPIEELQTFGLNQLLEINTERAKRWHKSQLGLLQWSALEWAGAMAGEAGEACNAAKKLKRLEDGLSSINERDRHYDSLEAARLAVAREVADTIIYGVLLMARVGIQDAESVIAEVFNRKSEEYGFPERLPQQGQARLAEASRASNSKSEDQ